MNIHIKNERMDTPTDGAIGYSCGRSISRKLQLHGVRNAHLGNPHPIGWCSKCQKWHDRQQCIEACANDKDWQAALHIFLLSEGGRLKFRRHVDLWCWCAPEACHCDLIKARLHKEFGE